MKVIKYEYNLILDGLRLLWEKEKDKYRKDRIENLGKRIKEEWGINKKEV